MFEVCNETKEEVKEIESIKKVLKKGIEVEQLNNILFNVILVDNEYIHELNRDYRHIDRPTDVITFALEDNKDFPECDTRILGDIYISIDKAHSQAIEYGHSFERELSYMVVHGFYHVMGYDHIKEEDKVKMRPKEEKVLEKLGIRREEMNEK